MTTKPGHSSIGVVHMATPLTVVIFGASGDLTSRKLIPALFNLAQKGRLPAEAKVLGVSRTAFTDDAFRAHLAEKAQTDARGGESFDPAKWAEFAQRVHYVSADLTQPDGAAPLDAVVQGQRRRRRRPATVTTSRCRRSSTRN